MFKKVLFVALSSIALNVNAETYEIEGKMKIDLEINSGMLSGKKCFEDVCSEFKDVDVSKFKKYLKEENSAIKDAMVNVNEVLSEAKQQAKTKIAGKKDLIEDGGVTYVTLDLLNNRIMLPFNVIKLDTEEFPLTVKSVLNYREVMISKMLPMLDRLPKSTKARRLNEIQIQSNLFNLGMKYQHSGN